MKSYSINILLAILSLFYPPLIGCSRVFWNDAATKIVIRSMDLPKNDKAKVLVSPRNYERRGYGDQGLIWRAKFGSVITLAFECATADGINEKGLAAHLQYLKGAIYSSDTNLPKIGIDQWIQYFLDTCATVKEVVTCARNFQVINMSIAGEFWPLLAVVEDSSGKSAIFEYIEGELHIHEGENFNVATNDPFYEIHLQNLKSYIPFGGSLPIPDTKDSLSRFVRAEAFLKQMCELDTWDKIGEIINIIQKTDDSWQTRWFTINDLQKLHYYFLTTDDKKGFFIDLNKLDFDQEEPLLLIDSSSSN